VSDMKPGRQSHEEQVSRYPTGYSIRVKEAPFACDQGNLGSLTTSMTSHSGTRTRGAQEAVQGSKESATVNSKKGKMLEGDSKGLLFHRQQREGAGRRRVAQSEGRRGEKATTRYSCIGAVRCRWEGLLEGGEGENIN